jgi:RES domain-containing protein
LSPIGTVGSAVLAWRLDKEIYAPSWDSGYGAWLEGGRWNKQSQHVVYASLDPATTILEKAVHTGFDHLDTVPHIVTKFLIEDFTMIEIVEPSQISNPNWLRPGTPNSAQQAFLAARLTSLAKPFVLVPSVISPESWNVLFDPSVAKGKYRVMDQTRFALDQRLSP